MTDSLVRCAGYLLPGAPGVSLSYALSAIGYQLLAISYWLSAIGYQLLAISYWLSAIGYQLIAFEEWGIKGG
jgi:hypothetical protein